MAFKLSTFLLELKRRKVYHVAVVYVVVGWGVAQGAEYLFGDLLGLSPVIWQVVAGLVALGFPIGLVLAWAYEVRPEEPRNGEPSEEEAIPRPDTETPTEVVPKEQRKSIAVLPFLDMSPEQDQEYFCDGMAEELINALTKVRGLRVAARTSSFHFRGRFDDVREIGQVLNVGAVLEGSVRRAENRLRVTAQLVSVKDGFHLWSETYERELKDVFAIQDEISRSIVETLRPTLLGKGDGTLVGDERKLVVPPTQSMDAYDSYLLGRHYWEGRYEMGQMTALRHFERAVQIDPEYALPHTGVADSYTVLGLYGYVHPQQARGRALTAVRRALELDDGLPDAYASLGYYHTFLQMDWEKGAEDLSKAIELNPDHPKAHLWLSFARVQQGRVEEALSEAATAQRLDPLSSYTTAFSACVRTMMGDFDTAAEMLKQVLRRTPDYLFAVWLFAWTLSHGSRHDDAVRIGERAADLSGNAVHFTGWLGLGYGLAGRQDRAMAVLDDLRAREASQYVSPVYFFWNYLGLGELERALDLLERAVAERAPFLFLHQDTIYRSLWSNSRFIDAAKKMGSGVVSRSWERLGKDGMSHGAMMSET